MNEWAVVGVIVTLVGLVATIMAPILKLNTSITRLTVMLDDALTRIAKQEEKAHGAHKEIWDKYHEHSVQIQDNKSKIADHENQLKQIEKKISKEWGK